MNTTEQKLPNSPPPSMVRTAVRIAGALALTGVAAFCVFGFLATNELGVSARLPWQRGYAVAGLASVVGAVLLLCPRRGRHPKS